MVGQRKTLTMKDRPIELDRNETLVLITRLLLKHEKSGCRLGEVPAIHVYDLGLKCSRVPLNDGIRSEKCSVMPAMTSLRPWETPAPL